MSLHPYHDRLIIGVDERFENAASAKEVRERTRRILHEVCNEFADLGIQLKLNTVLKVLGFEAYEIIQAAGLTVFADEKFPDVVDTVLSALRAMRHYSCIRRVTFRVEMHPDFLLGKEGLVGALEMMPDVSFLPVGPLTDNDDKYFMDRGIRSRTEALDRFCRDVDLFCPGVREVIMGPSDIGLTKPFLDEHIKAVTPAVRPDGLGGNQRNAVNATNVKTAMRAGSSAIIVASPIMGAKDRRAAAKLVLDQIGEALENA